MWLLFFTFVPCERTTGLSQFLVHIDVKDIRYATWRIQTLGGNLGEGHVVGLHELVRVRLLLPVPLSQSICIPQPDHRLKSRPPDKLQQLTNIIVP